MCGRYGFIPKKDFYDRFEIKNRDVEVAPDYNAAPGTEMPVVVKNSPKKLVKMRWGLVPFWAKDPGIGFSTINARSEEIEKKPAYRKAFRQQRCLVPANGFFEWRRVRDESGQRKIPYWVYLGDREIFGFAGVYDIWKDLEGKEIRSFSIVTTRANKVMAEIHNRMPVIVKSEDEEFWLNNQNYEPEKLKRIMQPYADDQTLCYRVSDLVNNPRNNTPEVLREVK